MPERTWPEDRYPTPQEWVDWFAQATSDERLVIAAKVMDASAQGLQCFIRDHQERICELEAAVDRVRRFHPRGDEESSDLAPGIYCPGCGEPRANQGDGGCRTRRTMDRR